MQQELFDFLSLLTLTGETCLLNQNEYFPIIELEINKNSSFSFKLIAFNQINPFFCIKSLLIDLGAVLSAPSFVA